MRITKLFKFILLLCAGLLFLGAGPGPDVPKYMGECYNYEDEDCSEIRVTGHSQGNHELDCTVILPWDQVNGHDPIAVPYPIIGWANGWGTGNFWGANTTEGYKPGLIEWALVGPYIVVAANQWSAQESDVLACVQWVIDNYPVSDDPLRIGLAGHSQGGGAVIKAGDGEPNGFDITTVIAMNPYGPGWVRPGNQDGPMMLIGGTDDTTTPTSSFLAVWDAIQSNGQGGLLAELDGGTHNSEAWGVTVDVYGNETTMESEQAKEVNFGRYQIVTELWWDFHLNGNERSGRTLKKLLDKDPWDTKYAFTEDFEL